MAGPLSVRALMSATTLAALNHEQSGRGSTYAKHRGRSGSYAARASSAQRLVTTAPTIKVQKFLVSSLSLSKK
jgi:hypothetical protein